MTVPPESRERTRTARHDSGPQPDPPPASLGGPAPHPTPPGRPPEAGGTAQAGEQGLFGPESVSWRVMADPVFAIGGLRALFLQALHPRAMAGVAQNSDLRAAPWGRLLRTARYVHTVTFGTSEQAERAAARVRAIHEALWAADPDSGARFRLDDAQALLWVHVVQAESFLSTARRAGARVSPEDADRYYREQVRAARLVGIDPLQVPASEQEVAQYYTRVRPELRLTEQAQHAARFLLWPPMNTKAQLYGARAGWLALSATAFALLPAWARRIYRLPAPPGGDMPAAVTARVLRAAAVSLPTPLRHGSPILQQARARLAATQQ